MLNWISSGVIDFAGYVSPFLFLFDVLVWFLLVKKETAIRKNSRILVKVGIFSLLGAAVSPLLIVVISGNLFPFLASSRNLIRQINSFAMLKSAAVVAFRGFSITGGILILTLVLLFAVKDAKKLSFAILSPFPLFAALARINCFVKGCCFGKPFEGAWAVKYPPASLASRQHYAKGWLPSRYVESFPVHPSQLYIIASMLMLFIAVVVMKRLKVKKNIILGTVLSGYGFFNFFIEFCREEPLVFNFVTVGQIMEFVLFLLGFYLIFKVREEDISENKN